VLDIERHPTRRSLIASGEGTSWRNITQAPPGEAVKADFKIAVGAR